MRAEIIAVGSELLTPHRLDTNSLYVTERLNEIGIEVRAKLVVGDDPQDLRTCFAESLKRADLIVLSGGLGPTDDDVTRDVVAAVLDRSLEESGELVEGLRRRFASRNLRMPEINRRQAMVPHGATVLSNPYGTAPGLWLEHDGAIVVLLPGPPRELKPMMDALVRGPLLERAGAERVFRRIVRVTGRTESHVEEAALPVYARWAADSRAIGVTILAGFGQIELHLSVRALGADEAASTLDRAIDDLRGVLGGDIFSVDGRQMEEVVGDRLRTLGLRIAVAESCTGGLTMSRLTDVPGSSAYVERGVVVYSNSAKVDLLGVSAELIDEHGAVSEAVARAMAAGIRERAGVDIGVGITGIAGPGGGTTTKPVGTVALAVDYGDETVARTSWFPGGREQVKFQASQVALDMVRRLLQ